MGGGEGGGGGGGVLLFSQSMSVPGEVGGGEDCWCQSGVTCEGGWGAWGSVGLGLGY